jgi:hypothetical protein
MRTVRTFAFISVILGVIPAVAQDDKKPAAASELAAPLRKFDRDKDGKLTGDELKAARQSHNRGGREAEPSARRWREILERQEKEFARRREKDFDSSGDGKLDDRERAEMREVWKAIAGRYNNIRDVLTAKYDRNDDGELNDQERNASRSESDRLRREAEEQCLNEWLTKKGAKPGP